MAGTAAAGAGSTSRRSAPGEPAAAARRRQRPVASRSIVAVLEDDQRWASTLPAEELAAIRARLNQARAVLSGTNELDRFHEWKSPARARLRCRGRQRREPRAPKQIHT